MGRTGPNRDFFWRVFGGVPTINLYQISLFIMLKNVSLPSVLGSFLRVPVPAVFSPVPSADPKTILYFIYLLFL